MAAVDPDTSSIQMYMYHIYTIQQCCLPSVFSGCVNPGYPVHGYGVPYYALQHAKYE